MLVFSVLHIDQAGHKRALPKHNSYTYFTLNLNIIVHYVKAKWEWGTIWFLMMSEIMYLKRSSPYFQAKALSGE